VLVESVTVSLVVALVGRLVVVCGVLPVTAVSGVPVVMVTVLTGVASALVAVVSLVGVVSGFTALVEFVAGLFSDSCL
jgi:hypothetical protein